MQGTPRLMMPPFSLAILVSVSPKICHVAGGLWWMIDCDTINGEWACHNKRPTKQHADCVGTHHTCRGKCAERWHTCKSGFFKGELSTARRESPRVAVRRVAALIAQRCHRHSAAACIWRGRASCRAARLDVVVVDTGDSAHDWPAGAGRHRCGFENKDHSRIRRWAAMAAMAVPCFVPVPVSML